LKKPLRHHLINKRDAITPQKKKLKEAAIEKRLFALDLFREATCVLFYVSFRSEVNTRKCLSDVIKAGKKLVLPRVDTVHQTIRLYETRALSELKPGYMGIPEPEGREDRKVSLRGIDLVIIPGVGFDLRGTRLGYGGGYYDRLLSYESKRLARVKKHIATIALAFEEQIGELSGAGNRALFDPHHSTACQKVIRINFQNPIK
jgi:5-formyltetrahydrofolate cyclo-ligase